MALDALEVIISMFINASAVCTALPVEVREINHENFQVMSWDCGKDTRTGEEKIIRLWQRHCDEGGGYWSRPFFLEDFFKEDGIYMNRFGELESGWRINLEETYVPKCGV